jgi:hypothetical protein
MKRIILVFGLVAFFMLVGQKAHACSCGNLTGKVVDANGNPVKIDPEEVKRYWLGKFEGAVFIGKVIKVEKVKVKWFDEIERMKKVTVNVERSWLGVNNSTFVIYTNPGEGGDCGVHYVKGERCFFYAPVIGGLPWTNSCSPKSPENELADMFKEVLGDGKVSF